MIGRVDGRNKVTVQFNCIGVDAKISWIRFFQKSRSYKESASSDSLTHDEVTEARIGGHPEQCHTGRNMHHIRRATIAGIWAHESTQIRWSADGPVIEKTIISQWSSYAATDDYWAARIDNHKTMMRPPYCRCWYDQRNLTSYCKNTWGFLFCEK